MSRKLSISPDVSYMLGIYQCGGSNANLHLYTQNKEMVERFVKIAVMSLETRTGAISITQEDDFTKAEIKNSKLQKLLDDALERRDQIFKYKNEYSASYFAAMFDLNGEVDKRGVFVRGLRSYDKILLERLGFHTTTNAGRCYVRKSIDFVQFIEPYSIRVKYLRKKTR